MREDYLPYYKPKIEDDDVAAVSDAMRRGWLTTGPKVRELEAAFAWSSGIRHAIAVNSCTAALQLGLVALGVGPGDEVIMPALTFVAGAECVRGLGAEPVFCDVDPNTLCITPETIEPAVGSKSKVIIPMHYGGQPGGIREIASFAGVRGIRVLEDAAHATGTIDGGCWPGTYSDAAAFSFYATKNITSGEGGMLLTNNDKLADRVRMLSLHGMDRDAWKRYMRGGTWLYDVIEVGYKCNLPDITAALAISQFHKLKALQAERDNLAALYLEGLKSLPGLTCCGRFAAPPDRHSWCIFAVSVDETIAGISRDRLLEELRSMNIGTSVHFIPTHMFSAYRATKRTDLTNTERVYRGIFSLPLYPGMTREDVEDVLAALEETIQRARSWSSRGSIEVSKPSR
jgi:dTDP-4-amino-4,6-dideoxygalactose transaminase